MSKLEETNAMIDYFNSALNKVYDTSDIERYNKAMLVTATCDIAKSLAIIADAVSKEDV